MNNTTLEKLKSKHAELSEQRVKLAEALQNANAQREQIVANLNAVAGAMEVLAGLIADPGE